MATRLTLIEFDTKLKHGTLTDKEYQRCLEVDPKAFCGRTEVTPIHPFKLDLRVSQTDTVRTSISTESVRRVPASLLP